MQAAQIEAQTNGSLPALAQYVKSKDQVVESMLGGVYTADNLEQALALRSQLCTTECIVTPKGALVGSNWLIALDLRFKFLNHSSRFHHARLGIISSYW